MAALAASLFEQLTPNLRMASPRATQSTPDGSFCRLRLAEVSVDAPAFEAAVDSHGAEHGTRVSKLPEFGGYRVIRPIGSGGMSRVYEALCLDTGAPVALKVVDASVSVERVRRFAQECRVLALLNHRAIVRLLETVFARDGSIGIAMELVRGESAKVHAARNGLSPRGCVRLILETLDALEYAHGLGIVHRDLKPENVLVDEFGRVRLVDFGVARLLESTDPSLVKTQTQSLVGTIAYMSPEQADGSSARIGRSTDVYQCAVLLFELLTGRLPYDVSEPSTLAMMKAILFDRRLDLATVAPDAPVALAKVIGRALSIDPAARPASAAEFAQELRSAIS